MKTFIMTLGELNFEATYINKDVDVPFLNFGIFILFALVMPIILMNMLVWNGKLVSIMMLFLKVSIRQYTYQV